MIYIKKIIKIICLLFVFINLFIISDEIENCIKISCNIWFYNLIPSMLPFYIISDLLVNYGFIDVLAFLFNNLIQKAFGLSGNASFVIFFSMITGFPSSAKYIKSLLDNKFISIEEANKLIRFTHFSNPLFIINVIGSVIIGNKNLGIFVLLSHYLSNFIIVFCYRGEKIMSISNLESRKTKVLSEVLTKSFLDAFNSLLIVLGSLITFQLLTKIVYCHLKLSPTISLLIESILEITQGLFRLKTLSFSPNLKAIISTIIISFGGLCIHMQVSSILSETKIKYKNYLMGRILQTILAPIILIIILFIYRV